MLSCFVVGVAFFVGPVLVSWYFPLSNIGNDEVCLGDISMKTSSNASNDEISKATTVDIDTPFKEVGTVTMIASVLFLLPLCLKQKMPGLNQLLRSNLCGNSIISFFPSVYEVFAKEIKEKESQKLANSPSTPVIPCDIAVQACIIIFYFATCSSEMIFQSMQFTFGLCGPLQLSPSDAVKTDTAYTGGFMLGR